MLLIFLQMPPYPHFHTHKTKFSTMSNRKSLKTFLTWKMYAIFSIPVEFGVYCVVIIKPIHIIVNLEQFLRTIKFEFPHMAQYGDPSRGKLLLKNNFQYFSVNFSTFSPSMYLSMESNENWHCLREFCKNIGCHSVL